MNGHIVKVIDDKTAKVLVVRSVVHPLYKKVLNIKKYYLCQIGKDVVVECCNNVLINECKPYSKMKKHIIVKVI